MTFRYRLIKEGQKNALEYEAVLRILPKQQ